MIAVFIWLLQRHNWKSWLRIICLVVIAFAFAAIVIVFSAGTGPVWLGSQQKWYEHSPYLELLFFALMLAGMSARYITKAIESRRDKIAELQKQGGRFKKPRLEFDMWEFSYPLFISVVTYGALLTQLKDHTLSAGNAILSFQNGFFWQTILATRQNKS
jgi:hypothetical protein